MAHRSWLALVVIDVADLDRVRTFGLPHSGAGSSSSPIRGIYLSVLVPTGAGDATLLVQKVPEPKTAKTRVHLDIGTDNVGAEVARLEALRERQQQLVAERGLVESRIVVYRGCRDRLLGVVAGRRTHDWSTW